MENETEYMLCANCGIYTVPISIGYCSKTCHDEDQKANEDVRLVDID